MIENIFLKPAAGLLVRDPVTLEPLPADGARVEMTTYWRRRLRDGDVIEVMQAPKKKNKRKRGE